MISSSEPLVHKCHYHAAGAFCQNGFLYKYATPNTEGILAEAVRLEGMPLQCPTCEGKGMLLTDRGREMLAFMDVFARPFLRDLIDELFEERKQH